MVMYKTNGPASQQHVQPSLQHPFHLLKNISWPIASSLMHCPPTSHRQNSMPPPPSSTRCFSLNHGFDVCRGQGGGVAKEIPPLGDNPFKRYSRCDLGLTSAGPSASTPHELTALEQEGRDIRFLPHRGLLRELDSLIYVTFRFGNAQNISVFFFEKK